MLEAHSQLNDLLRDRNMTVQQLYRLLLAQGLRVNSKSLYRLNANDPIEKLDLRVAGAICQVWEVNLSDLIRFEPPQTSLERLPARKQKRLDALMSLNSRGSLSEEERAELTGLVEEAESISLRNARWLASEHRALAGR